MAMPTFSTTHYPDEYIEHWGEFFIANRLDITIGITFEQFLAHPGTYTARYHEILNSDDHLEAAAARISQSEYEPPLVKQAQLREQIYTRSIEDALDRAKNGLATSADADFLERCISAARGIRHLPRQGNGHAVEKLAHHRHPHSQADFRRHQETKS